MYILHLIDLSLVERSLGTRKPLIPAHHVGTNRVYLTDFGTN
jgi:hypothetical protein